MKGISVFLCAVFILAGTFSAFEILSNHDINNNVISGLSEVKFNTANPVSEPVTLLILGVGLVGLAGFGRKKLIKYK